MLPPLLGLASKELLAFIHWYVIGRSSSACFENLYYPIVVNLLYMHHACLLMLVALVEVLDV